jgi:hypothetical protein
MALKRQKRQNNTQNLAALLRMNLLVYRDLWAWLDAPFTSPPPLAEPVQVALAFG